MSTQQRHWPRIKPKVIAAGALVTALGIGVALVNDSFSLLDRFAGGDPSRPPVSMIPSAPTSASNPGPTSPDASNGTQPSARHTAECTSTAGERIDCQLPHQYESYDGICDVDGLVSWLGGRSDVDVPRATVSASDGTCLVDFKVPVTGSGALAFNRADSSVFRKCIDERSRSVVTCAEPHTAEYIAADIAGVADEDACRDAAGDYLAVDIGNRSTELRVRAITSPPADGDNARCVIEVVGTERLAESVRDVKNAQLHWVA